MENVEIVAYVHFSKRGRVHNRRAVARQLTNYALPAIVDGRLIAVSFEAMSGNERAAAGNVAGMVADVAAEHGLKVARVEFVAADGWGWSTLSA